MSDTNGLTRKAAKSFAPGEELGGLLLVVKRGTVVETSFDPKEPAPTGQLTLANVELRNVFTTSAGQGDDLEKHEHSLEVWQGDGELLVQCGANQRFPVIGLTKEKREKLLEAMSSPDVANTLVAELPAAARANIEAALRAADGTNRHAKNTETGGSNA